MSDLTIVSAIEQAAAKADPFRGYHFHVEEGAAEPFYSYAGAERASARYGGALQALGLRKGDRVALILPDADDFIFTFLGAMRAGMVPVPIYPPMGLGQLGAYLDNTRHVVAKSGARALITTARIKRMLGTVEASCPALKRVVAIDGLREAREELRPVKVEPDDIALLQFTSGSTSKPKGVVLTHANLSANVRAINREGLRVSSEDVGVSWLPLYHDMGLIGFVIAPVFDRVPIVILPPLAFLRRPSSWLRAISRHRGTISYGPSFAYALAVKRARPTELEGVDLSSWRVAGCGAEPIRPETLEAFARTFSPYGFSPRAFVPSYGLAEHTLAVSFESKGGGMQVDAVHGPTLWEEGTARPAPPEHPEAVRLVRCGHAFDGHQIAVFDLDDEHSERPLPERAIGELRLRGPSLMRGYFDDQPLTAEAMAGGWFKTGDMGYLVDGEVVLCGRAKELLIVNGRNFYPQDIEWEASRIEAVRKGNVVAFGSLDPGVDRERVVVVFETPLATTDEREHVASAVRQAIQEGLGLTVDDVRPVSPGALPKTSSGKLQRLLTRRLYEQGELEARRSPREPDRVDYARELLRSQLAYAAGRLAKRLPARGGGPPVYPRGNEVITMAGKYGFLVALLALSAGCSGTSPGNAGGTFDPGSSGGSGGSAGAGGKAGGGGSSGKAGSGTSSCPEGTILCDGKTAQVCDGHGGYSKTEACSGACLPNKGCVACQPNLGTCDKGVSTYCREDGSGYETERCDPDMGLSCGNDGRCAGVCSRTSLGRSYIGCEYWPTVTSNSGLYSGFRFAVAVSNTGSSPAHVKIAQGGKAVDQRTVQPGALEVIQLPWVNDLKHDTSNVSSIEEFDAQLSSGVVSGGAFELKSDQPITVYQFNPLEFEIKPAPQGCPDSQGTGACNSFTNDASLLLPTNTLSREYIVASAPTLVIGIDKGFGNVQSIHQPGLVAVTATEDGTQVEVQTAADARSGNGVKSMKQGEKQTLSLNRGDVLQLLSSKADMGSLYGCKTIQGGLNGNRILCAVPARYDLSGSVIRSDKPVQVIGGHDCTFMPYSDYACDHIEESLFPLDTWGNEVLVTAPQAVVGAAQGSGAGDKQIVRVISGADGNMVTLDPPLFPGGVLNKGQYADVQLSNADFMVKGTGPILVAQYMAGGDVVDPSSSGTPDSKGDPSLSLAIPSAQFRTSYQFLAPATYTYNFVNVIAETGAEVTLDGAKVSGQASAIGASGFSVTRVPIKGGAHTISSAKGFGIMVYGYGAYTSYMYPGGLDLKRLQDPDVK